MKERESTIFPSILIMAILEGGNVSLKINITGILSGEATLLFSFDLTPQNGSIKRKNLLLYEQILFIN